MFSFWAWTVMSLAVLGVMAWLYSRASVQDRDIPEFLVLSLIVTGLLVAAPGVPGSPDLLTGILGASVAVLAAIPLRYIVNHDAEQEIIRLREIWLAAALGIWLGCFDAPAGLVLSVLLTRLIDAIRPPHAEAFLAPRFAACAFAVLAGFIVLRGFWPAETIFVPLAAMGAGIAGWFGPLSFMALPFTFFCLFALFWIPIIQEVEAMRPSRTAAVLLLLSGLGFSLFGFPDRPGFEQAVLGMAIAALSAAALRGVLTNWLGDSNLEGGEVYLAAAAGAWSGVTGLVPLFLYFILLLLPTVAAMRFFPRLKERTYNGAWLLSPPIAFATLSVVAMSAFA